MHSCDPNTREHAKCLHHGSAWICSRCCFFDVKCSPVLQRHGVFNLHCGGLIWGDVCSMHALFFFTLQMWWLCMGYLLGSQALYSRSVFRLFPFLPCHYSPLLSILFLLPVYPHMFYSHSKLPISHRRKQHHSPVGVRAAMSGLFSPIKQYICVSISIRKLLLPHWKLS